MSVTRSEMARRFDVKLSCVKQIGRKQLFKVWCPDGYYLVSYRTIVGQFVSDTWYLLNTYHSVTTSRQVNGFASMYPKNQVIFTDNLNNLESKVL
jgi:hypothetical protein